MQSTDKHKYPTQLQVHSVRTNPQDSSRSHLEVMGHLKPEAICNSKLEILTFKRSETPRKLAPLTLCGVLGTFRGGLGGVEASLEIPLSYPKIEGEYGELGPD